MFSVLYKTVYPFRGYLCNFLRKLSASSVTRTKKLENLLKSYKFSDAQISKIVRVHPNILRQNLQKNTVVKLKFFLSIGVTSSELPKIIVGNPSLLAGSLERQFIPCYNFIKSVVDSDRNVIRSLKNSPRIFSCNLKVMLHNVELLAQVGVPSIRISYFLIHYPHSVQKKPDKFKRSVDEAIRRGFDPSSTIFILAVHALCNNSEQSWENKIKVYGRFGLLGTEFPSIFRLNPLCMMLSEERITRLMEFYFNEMRWSPASIIGSRLALFYSIDRIVPRCRVIKILMKEGLVKEYSNPDSFLTITDSEFLTKFLDKYKNDLPQIMDVYPAGQDLQKNKVMNS